MTKPSLESLDLAPRGWRAFSRGADPDTHPTKAGGHGCTTWCEEEHRPALGLALKEADAVTKAATKKAMVTWLEAHGRGCCGSDKKRKGSLETMVVNRLVETWFPWEDRTPAQRRQQEST